MKIEYNRIVEAAARINGVARKTPVLTSNNEKKENSPNFYFKCENMQRIGAFKFRGAYNKIAALPKENLERGVVAFSSGNHARAVATSAMLMGSHAKIVMPQDAPKIKVAATREVGATIIQYDRYSGDRAAIAQEIADKEGRTLVPPFDDPFIICGQGTIGLELHEQIEDFDYVVLPTGGGGLLSGTAMALAELRPSVKIIGAESESANDTFLSMQKGERVEIPVPRTLADGMQVVMPGKLTFEIIRRHVEEIILVSENDIIQGMQFVAAEIRQIIEPTAAVAVAAARKLYERHPEAKIAIVLSGGNMDLTTYAKLLQTK